MLRWMSDSPWGTFTDEADEDVTEGLRQSHGKLSGVDLFSMVTLVYQGWE